MIKAPNIMSDCQRGMSLVEVLVAIVLFSIGSLMAVTMTTSSLKANSHSLAIDESVNLGRIKMEELLGLGYNDGQLQDTNGDGAAGLLSATAANEDHSTVSGRYRVTWNVAANHPVNAAKTVSVVVSWHGSQGSKQIVFQTIKSE